VTLVTPGNFARDQCGFVDFTYSPASVAPEFSEQLHSGRWATALSHFSHGLGTFQAAASWVTRGSTFLRAKIWASRGDRGGLRGTASILGVAFL